MNKKLIWVLAVLLVIVMLIIIFNYYKTKNNAIQNNETILFEKYETWGPCPPQEICNQSTKLFYSGKLILRGDKNKEKILNQETISQVILKIETSKIMEKNCSAEIIVDYWATTTLNLNGQNKTIKFPGCDTELKEIEKIFLTE